MRLTLGTVTAVEVADFNARETLWVFTLLKTMT